MRFSVIVAPGLFAVSTSASPTTKGFSASRQAHKSNELTVLVTGFDGLPNNTVINPSWEVAKSLPSQLPVGINSSIPRVKILVPSDAIPVSYEAVDNFVPTIWDPSKGPEVDIAVHLGMWAPRTTYRLEKNAVRSGYKLRDANCKCVSSANGANSNSNCDWMEVGNDSCPDGQYRQGNAWNHGQQPPAELQTDLDLEDIYQRFYESGETDNQWPGIDFKITSYNKEIFLCQYLYYSSMAFLRGQNRPGKVVFLHVPSLTTPEAIQTSKDVTMNLIRSIVESEMQRGM
ncbi:hypothetical protein DCS_03338 [Drechmeria coniospora]|uniref:Pyroglutamyl peptidase type I n=1 Tax=Drechmeria coniospora TaxID=98403 RepID=A0A151GGV8_DRECN|nr:hypothetical protein DCS_03338 [Drechmeria coniospora]KYK56340.1 hypothetical protein DCS_03338 [Drechmeria coniospora]